MRCLNDSTREALEGEIVNLEYDKTRIDAQIEAIRNLLARDRPTPDTAPAEELRGFVELGSLDSPDSIPPGVEALRARGYERLGRSLALARRDDEEEKKP